MNIDNIPKSLSHLIDSYKSQEKSDFSEERFKEYVRKIALIKLRRKPSSIIISMNDKEAINYIYSKL